MPGFPHSRAYDRQIPLNLAVPDVVVVVGCGGVGTWAAILFAMVGARRIILIDPDRLEATNLNRLPFTPTDINRPKVYVLRDFIARIRPCEVIAIAEAFQNVIDDVEAIINLTPGPGKPFVLVVDAVDRVDISNLVLEFAKKTGAQYLDVKYDGFSYSVRYSKDASKLSATWDADPADQGYRVVPSFVGTALLPVVIGLISVTSKDIDAVYIWEDARKTIRKLSGWV